MGFSAKDFVGASDTYGPAGSYARSSEAAKSQKEAAQIAADATIEAARLATEYQEKARLETAIAQAKATQDETIRVSSDLAEQVSGAVAYQAAVVARQTADDKRARQAAEVDRLEGLVTVLGPKGVRATALQNAVVDFEAAINVGLDAFGFRLSFTVDPWDVRISRDGGQTWLRFDLLSDGEKLWTGACFQQALAVVTGLEFVAVDATETVVGANRAMLTRLIMLSPVSQIVVAMAKGEADPLPEIDGLTVVQI